MKPIYALLWLALVLLLGCRGCNPPEITGITPGSGFARQIVNVQGSSLTFASVVWDAGLGSEQLADHALLTARYFQIPASAGTGSHPVKLRNAGGTSASSFNFTVNALSGAWPAPRIEETTINYFNEKGGGLADLFLLLSVANVDAKAVVTVNGTDQTSVLYSAIASDYFNTRAASTFNYPVYHYGGLLVFLTDQTLGSTLNISVRNTDGLTNNTTYTLPASAATLDSDNDGLLDTWETTGYPAPGGATIDLAAMGCNPKRKDILVEVDWTAAGQPLNTIWGDIEAVFANAPVLNPDGSAGVSIHIDRGQGGAFANGGQTLAAHTTMDFGANPATGYTDFFTYKNNNFDADRLNIFHYGIFGRARPNGSSGRGEIWGNDFMVTFATFSNWNNRAAQVGTFIHELGHNLALRHGGIDNGAVDANETFKPNQESTMNYRYQFPGISIDCDLTADAPAVHSFSRGMLRSINENAVNENAGICNNTGIDFNSNGTLQNPVTVNTNPSTNDSDNTDIHINYNEWGNMRLNFTAAGSRWNNN